MKITFLMPGYMWGPSGGYRVVYEYANQLVRRGHQVTVVHPRRLRPAPPSHITFRLFLRKCRLTLLELVSQPTINWHSIDKRVRLMYVPTSQQRYIPDADVLFATGWQTARPVMNCSSAKGEKCYLIQHYETWMGPKELVDATWRMPLRKVVIAQWLLELGSAIGARSMTYIPNAIDHEKYHVIQPIERRPPQVVMMCSPVPFKGSRDGIAALQAAKRKFPDLRVVLFGNTSRPAWVPNWMSHAEDPPQQEIVEKLYNGSSIVLGPSLAEGFGLPLAEGAACGCAIVATDVGGHREFVEHGVTGLLSPPKDPSALARNLCTLLGNEDFRVRLARSASNFIQQFAWKRSADLFEDFILQAGDRKPALQRPASTTEVSPA